MKNNKRKSEFWRVSIYHIRDAWYDVWGMSKKQIDEIIVIQEEEKENQHHITYINKKMMKLHYLGTGWEERERSRWHYEVLQEELFAERMLE